MQKRISELFLRSYILTLLDTLDNGGRHNGSFHPVLHGVYMHIALLPLQSSGLLRCLKCRRTINKSQLRLNYILIEFEHFLQLYLWHVHWSMMDRSLDVDSVPSRPVACTCHRACKGHRYNKLYRDHTSRLNCLDHCIQSHVRKDIYQANLK